MAAIVTGLAYEFWVALALALPAALFLVRLFMIQHDCGHGAFFQSRRANDLLGHVLGVLTLTPYTDWRRAHAEHHATSGNLDRRGVGDISTLTVREYLWRPALQRFLYRLYRHPLVMLGIGPTYQFLLRHRIPTGRTMWRSGNWLSALGTNAALAAIGTGLMLTAGPWPVLLGYLPVIMIAASLGVFLFYVQHQFEDTYWAPEASWDFHAAALKGSSFYDLPRALHWMTAYIGFHHIHHLSTRVPCYRLYDCFKNNAALRQARHLTLRDSFRCLRLTLWDEEARRLVPFAAIRHRQACS
jgi:omega-6 fatty acid desaturase (delta-12 desaturase)